MKADDLKNAMVFLERATATGKECFAWVQTYAALQTEYLRATTPAPQTPDSGGTAP